MVVIGITGIFGSGKTTVLELFKEHCSLGINTDKIVAELYKKKGVKAKIRKKFGKKVFSSTGKIDPEKLANTIFLSQEKKKLLESIIHPLVLAAIKKMLLKQKNKKVVAVEIPLLFESPIDFFQLLDFVCVVSTPKKKCILRMTKTGANQTQIEQRLKHQLPLKEKIKQADFVIDNSKTRTKTKQQVHAILSSLNRQQLG